MPFCKCKHGLWGRGVSRGPQVRALAKHFLAVQYTHFFRPTIYLKQNMIIFVKKLPDKEFIFLPLATLKIQEATVTTKINQFLKYSKASSSFLLFLTHRLIPPSAPTAIHNLQLAIKNTNLTDINILHLKNCTKMPHDIDILCCQPKISH
jgi:hypothetical protein